MKSMAPVLAIVKMVAGIVRNKDPSPDPDGEIVTVSPPGPGQVEFNKGRLAKGRRGWLNRLGKWSRRRRSRAFHYDRRVSAAFYGDTNAIA